MFVFHFAKGDIMSANQYQTPASPVDAGSSEQYSQPRVFATSGRIGRVRFLAYYVGMSVLTMVVMLPVSAVSALMGESGALIAGLLVGIIYIASIVLSFMFAIQRSHDMNVTGWLSLILIVPIIGFLVFCIAPGTDGENNYGAPPPPNGTGVVLLALLMPIITVLGILAAIAIPAYQGYIERAQESQYEQQRD